MRPEFRFKSGAQIGLRDLCEWPRSLSPAEGHHEVVEVADLGQGACSIFRIRGIKCGDGCLSAKLLLY